MNWIFETYSNIYNISTFHKPDKTLDNRPIRTVPMKRSGWRVPITRTE